MVEVHATNVRTDAYGGKVENHAHLMLEVTATVAYDLDLAASYLGDGKAERIALGRPFVANPDITERLQSGRPRPRSIRSRFMAVQVLPTVPASP